MKKIFVLLIELLIPMSTLAKAPQITSHTETEHPCPHGYITSKGCVEQCSNSTGFPYVLHEDDLSVTTKCVTEKECLDLNYVIVPKDGSCRKKKNATNVTRIDNRGRLLAPSTSDIPQMDFSEACTKFGGIIYQDKYCYRKGDFNMCTQEFNDACYRNSAFYEDSARVFCLKLGASLLKDPVKLDIADNVWLNSCDTDMCDISSLKTGISQGKKKRFESFSVLCSKANSFLEKCEAFGGTVFQDKYCFKQGGYNMCHEGYDPVCYENQASYKDSVIKFCKDLGGKVVSTPVPFNLPHAVWLDSNCQDSCDVLLKNRTINGSPYMRNLNYLSALCEEADTSVKAYNKKSRINRKKHTATNFRKK